MSATTAAQVEHVVGAVWRMESARIIGALARLLRDVGQAEEVAQDALLAALEHWPRDGIPDNRAAWLTTVAKRRALDRLRHQKLVQANEAALGYEIERQLQDAAPDLDAGADDDIGDDLLRLIFIACHPVLSMEARTALTLRLLGGLSTGEIARAFLVPEATVAQRIVRAKRTLAAARVPFEVPAAAERGARLASVLQVIYLIFNEGYTASAGDSWLRSALCDEALRLARILAELAPHEAEVHGLVALLELQSSRARARVGPRGEPVLLLDQDRARWDQLLIRRGCAALARGAQLGQGFGAYALQGAIAACHARAHGRRHRLGAHRRALRCAGPAGAFARGRTQSRGGAVDGLRAGDGAGAGRRTGGRRCAGPLSFAAQRAWRLAGQAGPRWRGARGIRTRRRHDGQ